ncbi:hypothetical protein ABW19_dt0207552 [Dactylella cylindrospora]|nr:hypothetical protein ABW19_dt0207552 [Dactylella cylindrospora]
MFEALFWASMQEKSSVSRQANKLQRDKLLSKLELCAGTIKLAIEKCGTRLRYKSVKAISSHITQLLSAFEEEHYDAVTADYVRALSLLFSRPSHREHLLKDDWVDIVACCCKYLDVQLERKHDQSMRASRVGGTSQTASEILGWTASEILKCLQYLTSTSQAYIVEGECTPKLVDTTIAVLAKSRIDSVCYSIFSILNPILDAVGANNLEFASKIVRATLPVLARQWRDVKLAKLREQLIIHALLSLPHILSLIKPHSESVLRGDLKKLLEELNGEYLVRYDRDRLSSDHLVFESPLSPDAIAECPLRTTTFAFRPGATQSEQIWMIPQLIASVIYMLDYGVEDPQAMDMDDINGVSVKRPKLECYLDEILRNLRSPVGITKILNMQVLCFYLDKWTPDIARIETAIKDLLLLCSDENTQYAFWAMLVMTT